MAQRQRKSGLKSPVFGLSRAKSRLTTMYHDGVALLKSRRSPKPAGHSGPSCSPPQRPDKMIDEAEVEALCSRLSSTKLESDKTGTPETRRDSIAVPKSSLEETGPTLALQVLSSAPSLIQPTSASQVADAPIESLEVGTMLPSQHILLPLFHRDRFPADATYELVFPALKLASHLLQTLQATHFLHALFWGVNESVSDHAEGREVLHPVRAMDEIKARDYELVRDELAAMAANITYEIRPLLPHERFQGMTVYTPCHDHGGRSKATMLITIAKKHVDAVRQGGDQGYDRWCEHVFRLAIILIHEVAHAAQGWALGGFHGEDYFERVTTAPPEAGYQMERQIFGSPLHFPIQDDDAHRGSPVIEEWPLRSPEIAAERGARGQSDKYLTWPVDTSFVRDLLDDTWWDHVVRTGKFEHLVPASVKDHMTKSRSVGIEPGVPCSLERMCCQDRRDFRHELMMEMPNEISLKPRTAAKPPRYDPCCAQYQIQFQLWTAGLVRITYSIFQHWSVCLWWLHPPESGSASEPPTGRRWGIASDSSIPAALQDRFQGGITKFCPGKESSLHSLDLQELEALTTYFIQLPRVDGYAVLSQVVSTDTGSTVPRECNEKANLSSASEALSESRI
ncbi:hypothetical protein B0A48_02357 [Cryoendolithus antarcticus]|uniref:Uncharacterized protein n=1 Tax=Cryoendolithus antarcticus TaxID=1507870 RepID=A0A1V8TND6_9PEZI|nr:hypothetical protein B0A48_02357 [Cryoendolithus antarcticus]